MRMVWDFLGLYKCSELVELENPKLAEIAYSRVLIHILDTPTSFCINIYMRPHGQWLTKYACTLSICKKEDTCRGMQLKKKGA